MQCLLMILRFLLLLTMVVVSCSLIRQMDALNHTLERHRLHFEQVLQEHQQFLEEHERRMEH